MRRTFIGHLTFSLFYEELVEIESSFTMQNSQFDQQLNQKDSDGCSASEECVISFQYELPASLKEAMNRFIERYPNWDQYRIFKAAMAGFLVQNGFESRSITRMYIGNMFGSNAVS